MSELKVLKVYLTESSMDALFSSAAFLGVTHDEAMNFGIQLLAQFIAGERGKLLTVPLADGVERTVHFH